MQSGKNMTHDIVKNNNVYFLIVLFMLFFIYSNVTSGISLRNFQENLQLKPFHLRPQGLSNVLPPHQCKIVLVQPHPLVYEKK